MRYFPCNVRQPGYRSHNFLLHPGTDDQRQSHGINTEDQRPLLGDDVKQSLDAVSLEAGNDGFMDGGDRAGMASGEGDEVLIGLLDRAEPAAQVRDRAFFEGDHRRHWRKEYAPSG